MTPDIPIKHPDFEGRGLAIRPSLFRYPRLVLDGEVLRGRGRRFVARNNAGQEVTIRLAFNHLDPIPRVWIGPTQIELASPLKWYEWAWIGLPVLLFITGGAIGAGVGFAATAISARVFRCARGTLSKFLLTGLVSVGAAIAYLGLALGFVLGVESLTTSSWKTFAPPGGGFSVSMPGEPSDRSQTLGEETGHARANIWIFERTDIAFYVGYAQGPGRRRTSRSDDELLDAARDGAIADARGTLKSETPIRLGEHFGRMFRIEVDNGRREGVFRQYLVGASLYQVAVITTPSRISGPDVERFFDSFRLDSVSP